MANVTIGNYSISISNLKHESNQHPFRKPLWGYHSLMGRLFTPLPATGKLWEVAKRMTALAALIIYPLFTILAIIGDCDAALSGWYAKRCLKQEVEKLSRFDKVPSSESGKFHKINNGKGPFDVEILFTVGDGFSDILHVDMMKIKCKNSPQTDIELASLIPILKKEMEDRVSKMIFSLFRRPYIRLEIYLKNSNQKITWMGTHPSGHHGPSAEISSQEKIQQVFDKEFKRLGLNVSYKVFDQSPQMSTIETPIFAQPTSNLLKEDTLKAESPKEEQLKEEPPKEELNSPMLALKLVEVPVIGDPIKEKLIKEFSPQMIEALGGIDKVSSFPIIQDWNGDVKCLTAPVMRGYDGDGTLHLIFCYLIINSKYEYEVKSEWLIRTVDGSWKGCGVDNELNLNSSQSISNHSLAEKFMLDKISRLMKGLAIGRVKKFPDIMINKPKLPNGSIDKDLLFSKINDAYLGEQELDSYMDLNTLYYETKPVKEKTHLFLWDPAISKIENIKLLNKKFPAMAFKISD